MQKSLSLIYLENMRLPTEKAHGIQIMKMCEAFAHSGIKTTLAVPAFNKNASDAFEYYDVAPVFSIDNGYRTPSFRHLNKLSFILRTFIFFLSFLRRGDYKNADVIFVRDANLAFLSALCGIHFVWEVHQDFYSRRADYAIKKSMATFFISNGLKEKFISYGIKDKNKLYVFPDAVGLDRFVVVKDKNEPRKLAGLPVDVPIVLYSGHLYEWKGAHILAEAASKVQSNVLFVFVGGTDEDVVIFREKYGQNPRIKILGRKPYAEMPKYKQSANILVIPNSARFEISKSYTSPLKLFSSMASNIPIIASDLPSLREIVDDKMVFFVPPDDPERLAQMIDYVIQHPEEAKEKSIAASNEIKKYTWDARARGMREIIEAHLP
ncbi:MAG: glycosyltransferase family 4 protein [Candidatus Niyogibacteria bacterium]|nr:glycosyltransferase family 4 protein [Candidatus Niyogibacteria bacterium]